MKKKKFNELSQMFIDALPLELGAVFGGFISVWIGLLRDLTIIGVLEVSGIVFGLFWGMVFLSALFAKG